MLADVDLQWVSLVLECGAVEGHDVERDGGKFWVIGQIVLLGVVPGVVVWGGVVSFVSCEGVCPLWDNSVGLVFQAGLFPGVFYVGVGRHGCKDLRGW